MSRRVVIIVIPSAVVLAAISFTPYYESKFIQEAVQSWPLC